MVVALLSQQGRVKGRQRSDNLNHRNTLIPYPGRQKAEGAHMTDGGFRTMDPGIIDFEASLMGHVVRQPNGVPEGPGRLASLILPMTRIPSFKGVKCDNLTWASLHFA